MAISTDPYNEVRKGKAKTKTEEVRRPQSKIGAKKQRQIQEQQVFQDFLLTFQVLEATLSKDHSFFLQSMKIFCSIKFQTRVFQVDLDDLVNTCSTGGTFKDIKEEIKEEVKVTETREGKNPTWEDAKFEFKYCKLTQFGLQQIQKRRDKGLPKVENFQSVKLSMFRKAILFGEEKIGDLEILIHPEGSADQQMWLVLFDEGEEEVGKIKIYLKIEEDVTSRHIRALQEDLKMQDDIVGRNQQHPGMVQDRTKDEDMPLRRPEQVFLLYEEQPADRSQSEPQSQPTLNSNPATNPMTQAVTQVTHQTQNSGTGLGANIGSLIQPQRLSTTTKSPPADNLHSTGPINMYPHNNNGGRTHVSTSLNGASNTAHLSQLNVGTALSFNYLETTNINPNNKMYEQFLGPQQEDEDDEEEELEEESEDNQFQEGTFNQEYGRPLIGNFRAKQPPRLFGGYWQHDMSAQGISGIDMATDPSTGIISGAAFVDHNLQQDIQEEYIEDDYGEMVNEGDQTQLNYSQMQPTMQKGRQQYDKMPQNYQSKEVGRRLVDEVSSSGLLVAEGGGPSGSTAGNIGSQQNLSTLNNRITSDSERMRRQYENEQYKKHKQMINPPQPLRESQLIDDDDESNINSDEQDEYMEYNKAITEHDIKLRGSSAMKPIKNLMVQNTSVMGVKQLQSFQVMSRPRTSTNTSAPFKQQFLRPARNQSQTGAGRADRSFQTVQTEPAALNQNILPPKVPSFQGKRYQEAYQNQTAIKRPGKFAISSTPGAVIGGSHQKLVRAGHPQPYHPQFQFQRQSQSQTRGADHNLNIGEIDDRDLIVDSDDEVYTEDENYSKMQRKQQKCQIGSNPALENETFSMKQDTFQNDPNGVSTADNRTEKQQLTTFVSDGVRYQGVPIHPAEFYQNYSSLASGGFKQGSKQMVKQSSESKLLQKNQKKKIVKLKKPAPSSKSKKAPYENLQYLQRNEGVIQHITSHSESSEEDEDYEVKRRNAERMQALGLNPPQATKKPHEVIYLGENKMRRNSAAKSKKNQRQTNMTRESDSIQIGGASLEGQEEWIRAPIDMSEMIESKPGFFLTSAEQYEKQCRDIDESSFEDRVPQQHMTSQLQQYQHLQDLQYQSRMNSHQEQKLAEHTRNNYVKNSSKKQKSPMKCDQSLEGMYSIENFEAMSQQQNKELLSKKKELEKMMNDFKEQQKTLRDKTLKYRREKQKQEDIFRKQEEEIKAKQDKLIQREVEILNKEQQLVKIHESYEEIIKNEGMQVDVLHKLSQIHLLMELYLKDRAKGQSFHSSQIEEAKGSEDSKERADQLQAFIHKSDLYLSTLLSTMQNMQKQQQMNQMAQMAQSFLTNQQQYMGSMHGGRNLQTHQNPPPILSMSTSQVLTPQPQSLPTLINQQQNQQMASLQTEQMSMMSNQRNMPCMENDQYEQHHYIPVPTPEEEQALEVEEMDSKQEVMTGQFNERNMGVFRDSYNEEQPPEVVPEEEEKKEQDQNADGEESSTSDFVPDPNFWQKMQEINENMRKNDEIAQQKIIEKQQDQQQHMIYQEVFEQRIIEETDSRSTYQKMREERAEGQDEEGIAIQEIGVSLPSQTKHNGVDPQQKYQSQENSQFTEIISDCQEEIPVEEETKLQYVEEEKTEVAVVQGTQGDFKEPTGSDGTTGGPMDHYQAIKKALERIGNQNQKQRSQVSEDSKRDSGEYPQVKQEQSDQDDVEVKEVDEVQIDFNNLDPEPKKIDDKSADSSSDEESEEDEKSVEYRGGKVYDEVKRAQYGIMVPKKL